MKNIAAALISGLLFGGGLTLGGMTQPSLIVGVLDVTGVWDPTLVFLFLAAVGTYHVIYRLAVPRGKPLFATNFEIPARKDINPPLLSGAALFGVGWALSGYCPGAAVVSLGSGQAQAIVVVVAIAAGMALFDLGPLIPRGLRNVPKKAT